MSEKVKMVLLIVPMLVLVVGLTDFAIAVYGAHAASPDGGMSPLQSNAQGSSASRANASFSALVTRGAAMGTALTGGMVGGFTNKTEFVYEYDGQFNTANGMHLHVHGTFIRQGFDDYKADFILTTPTHFTLIHGVGTPMAIANTGYKEYTGPFTLYSGNHGDKRVGYGGFSFLFVDLSSALQGLSFDGLVKEGVDKGLSYHGAISLNVSTRRGNINLYDGTLIPFLIHTDSQKHSTIITANPPHGKIIAVSTRTSAGYIGTFTGPVSDDSGIWTSTIFRLV